MRLPPEFDLHALEVFVLTVERGGMTPCAQHLRLTQSAVSQTIAKLEAGIGASLFDRSLRPLALTVTGKALFERGQQLIAVAKQTYDEIRDQAQLPIGQVTIGMSESLAAPLTAPLLDRFGSQARRWKIRSGISALQHDDFLARRYDMLVTGSTMLEKMADIDHHSVVEDPFILVFPRDYLGASEPETAIKSLPFIRFALDSGMGQRIESQIVRMKLNLPLSVEVDATRQQFTSVAQGLGWSITSLLCLAAQIEFLPYLRFEPLPRGGFARHVQVVARNGELGSLPSETAALARDVLRHETFPPVIEALPWAAQKIIWPA